MNISLTVMFTSATDLVLHEFLLFSDISSFSKDSDFSTTED